MKRHEKRAFWKFFLTYFVSIALTILVAGHFYYTQMYQQLQKAEHFSMINFARALKAGEIMSDPDFSYEIKEIQIDNFSMDTFSVDATGFHKYVPYQWHHGYYLLHKSRAHFDAKLSDLRFFIISVQLALLLFFALLSFFLAGNALLPMRDALMKLDMFSKDLIHDLNTPLTAMKLNLKLLQKEPTLQKNRALERLNKSLSDVTELHQNLHVLLEEETFLLEYLKVETLIKEVAQTQQQLYPNITWEFHCHDCKVYSNYKALKQILYNLLSNACKYNEKEGIVRIICQEGHLIIEDSGIGIQNPEKIFSRAYKEQQQGFGIGLDIVQRLCDAMHITIAAQSLEKGSRFTLNFQKSNTSSS